MRNVKFIFEDNENMLTSILLHTHSFNSKNIYFTSSNSRIIKLLGKVYNPNDMFIIVMDYVPNNSQVQRIYDDIRIKAVSLSHNSKNIVLLPTICFEQVILDMLLCYNYVNLDIDLANAIRNRDIGYLLTFRSGHVNLEHNFKFVLNKMLDTKFKNISKSSDGAETSFYNTGDLVLKAEQLYSCLPFVHVVSPQHKEYIIANCINEFTLNIDQAVLKSNSMFYDIFTEFNMEYPHTQIACII